MKKMKRLLALFTALILVCLSATGCNAIDEMRARHGVYAENGNVIMLGEVEYRLLPQNEYLSPLNTGDDSVYVTDKDVPVLLSAMFGTSFHSCNDGLLLYSGLYGEDRYYCRADKYDELAAQLTGEFSPTGYCYSYSVLDTEIQMYKECSYLLTKEQVETVDEVLATIEGAERAKNAHYASDYSIGLYTCTDNMLLQDWECDIEKSNNTYYIVTFDAVADAEIERTVPFEYNAVFDAIMKKKIDTEKAEKQYYSDLYDYDEDEYDLDYEVV